MQSSPLESDWMTDTAEGTAVSSGLRAEMIDVWTEPSSKERIASRRQGGWGDRPSAGTESERFDNVTSIGRARGRRAGLLEDDDWRNTVMGAIEAPRSPEGRANPRRWKGEIFLVTAPLTRSQEQVDSEFDKLAEEWERETLVISSPTDACVHPAYQRIIGLGPQALTGLVARLQATRRYWFWALAAIAGENPAEGLAQVDEAIQAWVDWAREKGITPSGV